MRTAAGISDVLQTILLACGILAPLLYLATDRLAGRLLNGYNFAAQSMSELSAAGAPTRSLVVSLNFLATVLMIAFGVGVWRAVSQAFLPRIVAGLLIGNVVLALAAVLFFPTHFGVRPIFASVGVIIMVFSVLFLVLAMIFGAAAFGGWLRILSIAIPAAYAVLAVLRFAIAGASSSGQTVSLIGTQERTMVYSFHLWVIALAIYLLLLSRAGADSASRIGG
ncbi:MAG: DUF998 domain-containing protein [Bacteroidota bacterium]